MSVHYLVHILISGVIHAFVYYIAWHFLRHLSITSVILVFLCVLVFIFFLGILRRVIRWLI